MRHMETIISRETNKQNSPHSPVRETNELPPGANLVVIRGFMKHWSIAAKSFIRGSQLHRCFICSTTPLCGQRMCNMLGAYNKMVGAEEKCLFCVLVLLRLCLCLCNKWMCVIKTNIHSFIFFLEIIFPQYLDTGGFFFAEDFTCFWKISFTWYW